MSHTANVTVTTDWVQLSNNEGYVMLQVRSNGPVLIHVGQSIPDSNSYIGFVMEDDDLSEWAISEMETGDAVFARALVDDVEVAVIESGAAA